MTNKSATTSNLTRKSRAAQSRAKRNRAAKGRRTKRSAAKRVAAKSAAETKHSPSRRAKLHFTADDGPGISRARRGKNFRYLDAKGRVVKAASTVARINSLAIPPAWTEVWISTNPRGHLQATGRDAKKRKQYLYHPHWREIRDEDKYQRLLEFGKILPQIRKRVAKDLRAKTLTKEKVLASVVRLLETSLIRVGNEEYVRSNQSFGLSTMRDKHVRVRGKSIRFTFKGKSGIAHDLTVEDPVLAKVVKACQDLPGQELFQYLDADGKVRDVKSDDVNLYLREIGGQECTAKDFRTFAGTVLAAMALQEFQEFDSLVQAKRNITQAIERVSKQLGNTPTICRKCYIHPLILNSYMDGALIKTLQQKTEARLTKNLKGLTPEEVAVLAFIHTRLDQAGKGGTRKKVKTPAKSSRRAHTRG